MHASVPVSDPVSMPPPSKLSNSEDPVPVIPWYDGSEDEDECEDKDENENEDEGKRER